MSRLCVVSQTRTFCEINKVFTGSSILQKFCDIEEKTQNLASSSEVVKEELEARRNDFNLSQRPAIYKLRWSEEGIHQFREFLSQVPRKKWEVDVSIDGNIKTTGRQAFSLKADKLFLESNQSKPQTTGRCYFLPLDTKFRFSSW